MTHKMISRNDQVNGIGRPCNKSDRSKPRRFARRSKRVPGGAREPRQRERRRVRQSGRGIRGVRQPAGPVRTCQGDLFEKSAAGLP